MAENISLVPPDPSWMQREYLSKHAHRGNGFTFPRSRCAASLGPTRLLLNKLVEETRSTMARGELRERVAHWGVARTLATLARRTMECGIHLTSKEWDAIEAADLHELAFLYGAVCRTTMSWEVHQAVRALLENGALRQA